MDPEPIPLDLWGEAEILFGDPDPFFDPGTPDNPNPVPEGDGPFTVEIELVELSLRGLDPLSLGDVELRLQENRQSLGRIEGLQNESGSLLAESFFDIFIELEFDDPNSNDRMTIFNEDAIRIGMTFTAEDEIPEDDFFWLPIFNWAEFPVNSPELVDLTGQPWDTVVSIHTDWTIPAPATAALMAMGLGILAWRRRGNRIASGRLRL